MPDRNDGHSGPKAEWEHEKTFERNGVVLQLQRLPLRWPRFSYTICVRGGKEGDKIMRFIPVRGQGQGKIKVESLAATIHDLVAEVEEYVSEQLQKLEDTKIENQQTFEQRTIHRESPRYRPGLSGGPGSGKTDRRRQRRANRDAKGAF